MSKKMNLLSIGDMSKLTGASLRSIRYYEKINLLKPVYIDPDSGYRYYSFEQSYHIEMIMFCVELDIPLKELPSFVGVGDTMDYRAFLAYGKEIAQKKLQALESGLKLINGIEKQMDLSETYTVGQIYTRNISEKYFACKPCKTPLEEIDRFELVISFFDIFEFDIYKNEMFEYGFLCEHTQTETSYYAFIEVPKRFTNKDVKKIPAATYLCMQNENPQIEKAQDIFIEHLKNNASYIAIETEIFTSKSKISNPINELRIITQKTAIE